ncbi:hypothetical protein V2J09_017707 [Rumex salicifolius]
MCVPSSTFDLVMAAEGMSSLSTTVTGGQETNDDSDFHFLKVRSLRLSRVQVAHRRSKQQLNGLVLMVLDSWLCKASRERESRQISEALWWTKAGAN